jgi:hypothetical protein
MNFLQNPEPKILFICKHRHAYGGGTSYGAGKASGLFNSAKFVSDMLVKNGIDSKIIEVVDNNSIDKEVKEYQPTHVIIEALWVVPEKFEILTSLYPNIKWIIRIHSETPFLANEGIALEWIFNYLNYPNVIVSFNSKRTNDEYKNLLVKKYGSEIADRVVYLPNYYGVEKIAVEKNQSCYGQIHVGAFGAIRPLKNQLQQAIAAIQFADIIGKELHFHINSQRLENRGEPVLKNLRSLFANSTHTLVEHAWMPREEFLKVMAKMDIGMQVSFSETFNIVSADFTSLNIPVVASNEIEHIASIFNAKCTSSKNITWKLLLAWFTGKFKLHFLNKIKLKFMAIDSEGIWLSYMNGLDEC